MIEDEIAETWGTRRTLTTENDDIEHNLKKAIGRNRAALGSCIDTFLLGTLTNGRIYHQFKINRLNRIKRADAWLLTGVTGDASNYVLIELYDVDDAAVKASIKIELGQYGEWTGNVKLIPNHTLQIRVTIVGTPTAAGADANISFQG